MCTIPCKMYERTGFPYLEGEKVHTARLRFTESMESSVPHRVPVSPIYKTTNCLCFPLFGCKHFLQCCILRHMIHTFEIMHISNLFPLLRLKHEIRTSYNRIWLVLLWSTTSPYQFSIQSCNVKCRMQRTVPNRNFISKPSNLYPSCLIKHGKLFSRQYFRWKRYL